MSAYHQFRRESRRIALCGLMTALSAVVLSLGGLIPLAGVACPMLAMLCLLPVVCDYGAGAALVQYAASAVLGLLLCADREAALLFVFLGWYPALRPKLEKLRRPLRIAVKAGLFCLSVTVMYALILWLFRLEAVVEEFAGESAAAIMGLLAFGCLTFLLFDRTMGVLSTVYRRKRRR